MPFIELDPELAWKLIEGYQNELGPENAKLEALYRQFVCPRCQGPWKKEFISHAVFSDANTMVGRAMLRCQLCDCLFNPHVLHDGKPMILQLGNPAKVYTNDSPIEPPY